MKIERTRTISDMPAVHDLAFDDDEITDVSQTVRDSQVAPDKPRRGAITMLRGHEPGRMFLLEDTAVVGRDKNAEVHIDDKGLSRSHARITLRGTHYMIEDLDSRNGTYVDGDRVREAVELHDGARIIMSANVVFRFNLVDEIEERVTKQLFEASTRDGLTGLYNRRYLDERLAAEVSFAHRHKHLLGFLLFDIDHFKKVNDTHGHLVGDAVLQTVGGRLVGLVRAEDVVARYGGEELAVLVRGVSVEGLTVLAERLRRAVSELLVVFDGGAVRVTVSVGVATLQECDEHATGDLLIALADERLYRAKSEGRNRVVSS
jgi:two-component system, cell cycle response regulator